MTSHYPRCIPLVLLPLVFPAAAQAATITYVNGGPVDSRIVVGFANNSSSYTTTDLIQHPSAYSRNDTAYGPLPLPGDLANFDAQTYAASEFGTNLNAPLGTGIRSAFVPLNLGFFKASGSTLQPSGFYTSEAFAYSGQATSTSPTAWIIHVDPSVGEIIGTPTTVTIHATIDGSVSATGTADADASWSVATTLFGGVIAGSSSQVVPGSTSFSNANTIQFIIPLGSTFELLVDYDLYASGSGAGASSIAEINIGLVEISAIVGPPSPVLLALEASFSDITVNAWTVNATGTRWIAECEIADRKSKLYYRSDGVLMRHDEQIPEQELPNAVRKAIRNGYAGYRIQNPIRIEHEHGHQTTPQYRVRLVSTTDDLRVFFDKNGTVLKDVELDP